MSDTTPEYPVPEEYPADSAPVESAPFVETPEIDEDEPSRTVDPALALIILVAVMLLGFGSLAPDVRYTIVWTILTIVAVVTIISDRINIAPKRPQLSDLVAGVVFGSVIGVPLLLIGGAQLNQLSTSLFGAISGAAVFQMMVFTMPLAETLFFRGAMQSGRGLIFTGAAAGVWAILLFFPYLNIRDFIFKYPVVTVVIGTSFVLTNFLYSYMRERFGIFTSWTCQITINLLLLFASRFVG